MENVEKDKFSEIIKTIFDADVRPLIKDTLEELYPKLKSDKTMRDQFADYIDPKLSATESFYKVCAMIKLGSAMNEVEKDTDTEYDRDRYEVLHRYLQPIYAHSSAYAEEIGKAFSDNETPLTDIMAMNIDEVYARSGTMCGNEFNPTSQDDISTHIMRIKRCDTKPADIVSFLKQIEEEHNIASKTMMLLGAINPNCKDATDKNDPRIAEFYELVEKYPRYAFTVCADMFEGDKTLTDITVLNDKIRTPDVIERSISLTNEQCYTRLKELHISSPEDINEPVKLALETKERD